MLVKKSPALSNARFFYVTKTSLLRLLPSEENQKLKVAIQSNQSSLLDGADLDD